MKSSAIVLAALGAVAVVAGVVACGSARNPQDTPTPSLKELAATLVAERFSTAVAVSSEDQFTVYWLGPNPTVESIKMTPLASVESQPGLTRLITLEYSGDDPSDTSRAASLELTAFSPDGWKAAVKNGAIAPQAEEVAVAGRTAYLLVDPGLHDSTYLTLAVDFGDGAVVARADPLFSPDDADLNVLTDRGTFLRLLGNLRPYPQQ